jgi:tRNA(fMet)-specific endonuclease VapC
VNKTYMLDTCICSFIMREQPEAVLKRLEQAVLRGQRIVVSAITYSEMRFGATGPKASRATSSWSTRSAPASMPSCPGIALRWTPPRRLRWRCGRDGTPTARTTRHCRARHRRRCRAGDE